jgi:hypothetical protein
MAAHPVDTLAHLPSPPLRASSNTAALFNGELLAYGSASSVVIVDVSITSANSFSCTPLSSAI